MSIKPVREGSRAAQVRAAANLAQQAASGPDESQRLVAAGGLQPLLLRRHHRDPSRQTAEAAAHGRRGW